jgi:hypothetical protein
MKSGITIRQRIWFLIPHIPGVHNHVLGWNIQPVSVGGQYYSEPEGFWARSGEEEYYDPRSKAKGTESCDRN